MVSIKMNYYKWEIKIIKIKMNKTFINKLIGKIMEIWIKITWMIKPQIIKDKIYIVIKLTKIIKIKTILIFIDSPMFRDKEIMEWTKIMEEWILILQLKQLKKISIKMKIIINRLGMKD